MSVIGTQRAHLNVRSLIAITRRAETRPVLTRNDIPDTMLGGTKF
jgi:hypothetical protein